MENTGRSHWNSIYKSKPVTEVSWFQEKPSTSLDLIRKSGVNKDERIIDVEGGASTLIDYLLFDGYKKITILDISSVALEHAKQRLGEKSSVVDWVVADATTYEPLEKHFSLWHDRAVFHFLTKPEDQVRYVNSLKKGLRPAGILIMVTFGIGGATKCSNLDVKQYNAEMMMQVLGPNFELQREFQEKHVTPSKAEQLFWYGVFRYNRA